MGAVGVAAAVCVVGWFAALSAYDITWRRLPNALTVPGAAAMLCGAAVFGHGIAALAGAVALGLSYLLIHLAVPAGLGAGDVKLAVGVGALTGAFGVDVWALAALAAPLLTGLSAVVVALFGPGRPGRTVPHGPSMCVAATAAVAAALAWP